MPDEIERLVVRVLGDVTDLRSKMSKAERTVEQFGYNMTRVGRALTLGLTLPLLAVGAASTKLAADSVEAANKFDVVFGGSADRVRRRLEELHSTVPLTRHEMEGLASALQDMLVPMGVARESAADMSVQMLELGADIASFNNVATSEALDAFASALAGQSRPLRRWGIDVRETRLQAIALEEGLIRVGQTMTSSARAQAVLIAATRDSKDAIGDAARTADETANALRFLWRNVRELGVTIGQQLVPVITPLVNDLNELLRSAEGLSAATLQWAIAIGAVLAILGPLAFGLGKVIQLTVGLRVALLSLGLASGPAGWIAVGIGALVVALTGLATWWTKNKIAAAAFGDEVRGVNAAIREAAKEIEGMTNAQASDRLVEVFERIRQLRLNIEIKEGLGDPEKEILPWRMELGRLERELKLLQARVVETAGEIAGAGGGGGGGGGGLAGAANVAGLEFGRVLDRVRALQERLVVLKHDLQLGADTVEDQRRIRAEIEATTRALNRAADAAARMSANLPTPSIGPVDSGTGAIVDAMARRRQMMAWAMATGGFDAAEIARLRGVTAGANAASILSVGAGAIGGPAGGLLSAAGGLAASLGTGGVVGAIGAVGAAFRGLRAILGDSETAAERAQRAFADLVSGLRFRFSFLDISDPSEQFQLLQTGLLSQLDDALAKNLRDLVATLTPENFDTLAAELADFLENLGQETPFYRNLFTGGLTIDQIRDVLGQMESLADAAGSAARGLNEMARVLNAPEGFKIDLLRYRATEGLVSPPGGGGGGGTLPPIGPGLPTRPGIPDETPTQPGVPTITIAGPITVITDADPREGWENFKRALRYGAGSGDPLARDLALGGGT